MLLSFKFEVQVLNLHVERVGMAGFNEVADFGILCGCGAQYVEFYYVSVMSSLSDYHMQINLRSNYSINNTKQEATTLAL